MIAQNIQLICFVGCIVAFAALVINIFFIEKKAK